MSCVCYGVNTAPTKTPLSTKFSFFLFLFQTNAQLITRLLPTESLRRGNHLKQQAPRALPQYLMPHEVLLESVAVLKDFETVRTEQVPRVFVDHSEMAVHLRIER